MGASGEILETSAHTYLSSMRSPTTRILFPCHFWISWARPSVIVFSLSLAPDKSYGKKCLVDYLAEDVPDGNMCFLDPVSFLGRNKTSPSTCRSWNP